jgi:ATP-dependent DNA helicase RecQ
MSITGSFETLLRERFGLSEFRPGQREVLEALSTHNAALAVFPTGGGKSLCYQLPALAFQGVTLVVSPLIALMKDQIDSLTARGIEAGRLDSSLSLDEIRAVMASLRAGSLKLLYVAPERFNNERFLDNLKRVAIALFAVDEAHCISEWGHNFRPDYLKLAETAKALRVKRVLALTATATPAVVEDICAGFSIPRECAVLTGFYRSNLNLWTTTTPAPGRDAILLDRLRTRTPGPTIVYVTLQKTAERIAAFLKEQDFPARAYHAGMETEARTEVQEWWMASDRNIVVATIAFGMGIDKANVRYVYHYNLPKSLESYSQEIGRAGRDGAASIVELFACPDDIPVLENFAYGDTPEAAALEGLVGELLKSGTEFDVSLYALAGQYDIRPLVLQTALTYLELSGVIRQGTPFFAGYRVRPIKPPEEIIRQFDPERARFVRGLFGFAKKGRTWYSLNPAEAAKSLGQERTRIVSALEYLEQRGWVELEAADIRHRFSRLRPAEDPQALVSDLVERFHRREKQEVARIQRVLELVTHAGCQTNFLVGYFGEARLQPCGHCTYCDTGRAQELPPRRELPPISVALDKRAFLNLRAQNAGALGAPRQAARFLCGLSSPALTKMKLSRHELFGALSEYPFAEILDWCSLADT